MHDVLISSKTLSCCECVAVFSEFVINFAEKVYIYEESDQNTEVCLVGDGEIAQQVTATVSSFILATATGVYVYVIDNL